MIYEEIKARAVAEKWNGRKIKDAAYAAKLTAEQRSEIREACGLTREPQQVTPAVEVAAPALTIAEVAPIMEAAVEVSAPVEDINLEDGAIIFCDAARNVVSRVVNGYGKKVDFDNGGARIGIKSGKFSAVFFNSQCYHPKSGEFDQFMAECFAVLKAVEVAKEHGLENVTICNDRIGGFSATTKRGYKAATYLWVAKKMAAEAGIEVIFDQCSGTENVADSVSRRNV